MGKGEWGKRVEQKQCLLGMGKYAAPAAVIAISDDNNNNNAMTIE